VSGGQYSIGTAAGAERATDVGRHALDDAMFTFRRYRDLGERAMAQLSDDELRATIDDESNSVALVVKHIGGNLRSRWTDFLTTDGEKPDRDRDSEFVLDAPPTRAQVMAWWDDGWASLQNALQSLRPEDLLGRVTIRGEPHTVLQAINRSLAHVAYHVGQIVFLAKHLKATEWKTLSIPKKKS
jgi:uncharacterized damage-inducible protein DinB